MVPQRSFVSGEILSFIVLDSYHKVLELNIAAAKYSRRDLRF